MKEKVMKVNRINCYNEGRCSLTKKIDKYLSEKAKKDNCRYAETYLLDLSNIARGNHKDELFVVIRRLNMTIGHILIDSKNIIKDIVLYDRVIEEDIYNKEALLNEDFTDYNNFQIKWI